MKKLRNEKPELSKKSPFYITKYRYYELKNFCLQYPDWKKALEQVNGWESNSHEISGIIRGCLPESSTERQAIIRAYYSMHIDIVDRCVAKLEPAIAPYVLRGVTEEVCYATYCPKCKNFKVLETDEPCNECLTECAREGTVKPAKFEEKTRK